MASGLSITSRCGMRFCRGMQNRQALNLLVWSTVKINGCVNT